MVTVLRAPEKKQSLGSSIGEKLSEGIERGASQGAQFAQQMNLEKARGRGLAQETKQMEKIKNLEMGIETIDQMRGLLKKGNLGRFSAASGIFSGEVRKDRASYEQLGRSLIPLVAAGVPIRNQREFDEYKKVLTNPSASDDEIAGALDALESLLSRSSGSKEDFSDKIMEEGKKKSVDFDEPVQLEKGQSDDSSESGEVSSVRSKLGALAKGLIRGGRNFSPLHNLGAIRPEMAENLMNQFLPSNEGGIENALEFAGENAPAVAAGPGGVFGKIGQALLGGALKSGAKETNMPWIIQEAANLTGMIGPSAIKGALSKKMLLAASDKNIYEFLKKSGFSDKEITPFLQNKKKVSFFSKFAKKSLTKEELRDSLSEMGDVMYSGIREKAAKLPPLKGKPMMNFIHRMEQQLEKIPKHLRKLIQSDVDDLFSSPIGFNELRDFEMLINDKIKSSTGGRASIGILKKPLKKAQADMSPSLFKEKELANEIYSRGAKFSEQMGKHEAGGIGKLVEWGPLGSLASALYALNVPVLVTAGITVTAPFLAKQMLTNPRFYNMHAKLVKAIKSGDKAATLKITQLMVDEINKKSQ